MNGKPIVIQTEHLHPEAVRWLGERATLIACALDSVEFGQHIAQAEGLIVRTYTRIDDAMLDQAPRLRVIGRAGVGVDNIDIAACAKRGITVVNTPGANTRAVVEWVFGAMLQAVRPISVLGSALDRADWIEQRAAQKAPRQLDEITLGIYGLGRIGKAVARTARAGFAMTGVIYHDLVDIPIERRQGAEPVTRAELLANADVLTIHVDGRSGNHNLINAEALGRLRDDVVLLNASRGMVVSASDLADFLKAHKRAQARLDVHESEPFGADYALLQCPNAYLTAHVAGRTARAMRDMSDVVYDVWRVLRGEEPKFAVVAPD